jgi:hypothetical protein
MLTRWVHVWKHNYPATVTWLLGFIFFLMVIPAFAEPPTVDEVLAVSGMDKGQIAELAQGQPVSFALGEIGADDLAVGVAWYLPIPLAKVAGHLRLNHSDSLDIDVTAYGLLTEHDGADSLTAVVLSEEVAQALLDAEPGSEFNLSAHEIDSFNTLKNTLKRTPYRPIVAEVGQHYQEILFQRFKAYRRGGTNAIAPYAREESKDSKPSLELRQAANASTLLARYFPALSTAWLDYPKTLPPGATEAFPWVEKTVEGRSAVILRHRVNIDWNGGVLVLTREFYAPHSYNSSQWITGCLPYHDGTVVFQQVHSYTDQVAGIASDFKHIIGRKLLTDKMLNSFNRLCSTLGRCQ